MAKRKKATKKTAQPQKSLFEYVDIKIKSDFSRSANLKKDFESNASMDHVILSEKFQKHFVDLASSFHDPETNQRVFVISGTPGVGKSTFSVFLSKTLAKQNTRKLNQIVSEQKKRLQKEFLDSFDQVQSAGKSLLVFLNGDEGEIEEAFFQALKTAFEEAGLVDEFKEISADSSTRIMNVIRVWKRDFPEKYEEVANYLNEETELGFDKLYSALRNGRRYAIKEFTAAYVHITGGASLQQVHHGQVVELFSKATKALKKKRFTGITVIYDEFGKYLERGVRNPSNFDLQFLQDFAELANRSAEAPISLLLITHLPISQYAVKLPVSIQQEWAKIEGRFEQKSFNDNTASQYTVLSSVFETKLSEQSRLLWTKVKKTMSGWQKSVSDQSILSLFVGTSDFEEISSKCYPLHPSVTALLPLISEKVAQNERTLFSYLTRDEEFSLAWRLRREPVDRSELSFVRPLDLYQYFKPLIANDVGMGGAYKIGIILDTALSQVESEVEQDILSLLGISAIVNNRSILKLTNKSISALLTGLYDSKAVAKAIKSLVTAKLAIEDKAKREITLFEGSSVDLAGEIAKVRQDKLTSEGYLKVLEKNVRLSFVIPKKYNFENGIIRFFREFLCSHENVKKTVDPNFESEDGQVVFVPIFNPSERKQAISAIKKLKSQCTLFVVPNEPLNIEAELLELHAIDQVFAKKEILSAGVNVPKELKHYKETTQKLIEKAIQKLRSTTDMDVEVFNAGKTLGKVYRYSSLGDLASDVCFESYVKYPVFNNEMVNKHKASIPVIQGRRRLVEGIFKPFKKNFGIETTGPEFALAKALQKTNSFRFKNTESGKVLGSLCKNAVLSELFADYCDFLKNSKTEPKNVYDLVIRWKQPPFGVREPLVPLYMSIFHQIAPSPVSYYFNGLYVARIDVELFDNMLKQPKRHGIQMVVVDKTMQTYLNKVSDIFLKNVPGEKRKGNNGFLETAKAASKYYSHIPEYSRRLSNLRPIQKKIIATLGSVKEPERFFLKDLPMAVIEESFDEFGRNEFKDFYRLLEESLDQIFGIYPALLGECVRVLNGNLTSLVRKTSKKKFKEPKKGEPLAKMWQKAWADLPGNVREYPFQDSTQKFVNRIQQLSPDFANQTTVENLSDIIVGTHPRNWTAKGISLLEVRARVSVTEIVQIFQLLKGGEQGVVTIAGMDKDGKPGVTEVIRSEILSKEGKAILKKLKSDLNDVELTEANSVLLSLLAEINSSEIKNSQVNATETFGPAWG